MKTTTSEIRPTITLRLKPHLQEFVLAELRKDTIGSRKNLIGVIIRPFLDAFPRDYVRPPGDQEDLFTFSLPLDHGIDDDSNRCYIDPENQKLIEDFLEWHFRDLFFHYMDDKMRYHRSFKKCILQFCSDTRISFTRINYEMLKKSYYRRRKNVPSEPAFRENSSGKIVPRMSPGCPYVKQERNFTFLV